MRNKFFISTAVVVSVGAICISSYCISKFLENKNVYIDSASKISNNFPNTEMYQFKHQFFKDNEMPILGMVPPVAADAAGSLNPSFANIENYRIYKDAGFNMVLPCYERTNFKEAECREVVQICNKLGLVYFANDTGFRCSGSEGVYHTIEEYSNMMNDLWYSKENSYAGIASKDEPTFNDFDEMGRANKAFKNKFGNTALFHSTLLPYAAPRSMIGVGDLSPVEWDWNSYQYYVDEYVKRVDPNIIAFDSYLWHVGGAQGLYTSLTKDHFTSLSLFKEKSMETSKPYWVTLAVYKHAAGQQYTEEETAWTLNTSLAYGCKGVQYYIYWPLMEGYSSMDYSRNINRTGCVSGNGIPLDAYYRIKHINSQIKAVEDILMPAENKGIMQFGEYQNIIPQKDILSSFGSLVDITGGDSFVGCFTLNNKNIYYVVNDSINDGTGSGITGDSVFKMNFNKKVNVKYFNNDLKETAVNNAYSICFTLSAGQAMLVEEL